MCTPILALATLGGPALLAGSQGLPLYANYLSGKAEIDALGANRDYARRLSQINKDKADYVRTYGAIAKNRSEIEAKKVIASQQNAFASSGIDVAQSATAQEVLLGSADIAAQNALDIEKEAAYTAWGFEQESVDLLYQANMLDAQRRLKSKLLPFELASGILGLGMQGFSTAASLGAI